MAIDQRDVSSTLRFMDDRALQQYAAMHKNDPYIFPLAFQESQNRQRLRMSQQRQAGAQPQPKVADQALAQMAPQQLPEDVGIGALPAPNMTMAAEGGIMGYEGYDEGPSDFGQGPVMMMSGGGVARYNGAQGSAVSLNAIESKYQKELQEINTGARVQYSPDVQEYVNARAQTSPDSTPVQVNPIPNAPPQAPARPPLDAQAMGDRKALAGLLESIRSGSESAGRAVADVATMIPRGVVGAYDSAVVRPMRAAGINAAYLSPKLVPEGVDPSSMTPFTDVARMRSAAGQNMTAQAPTAAQQRDALSENQAAAAVDASRLRDGRKDTGRKDTGRKDPSASASAKTDTGGLDSIIKDFTRQTDLGIGESRNARVGLAAALEQTPKTRAERNAEERAKEGDVFAGREARLAEREKGIEGMGDKYLGLALLQAGAAMMSTPGNIGAALGKGIAVGSERYIAGIDKINAAKDKFAEARDRLEDLRLNRADMTKKEVREEQRDIDNGVLQAKKLLADGLDNDLKVTADKQKAIFGAVAERENVMIRERGANTRAAAQNRNTQLETLRAVQADPTLAAAYRAMNSKGVDVMGEYNDFLKANPALATDPKAAMTQFLMTKSVFSQLGGGTVTDTPSTKVRTQP